MAKRAPSPDSSNNIHQSHDQLTESIEQLSDDINGLMEVAEQGTLLKQLVTEVVTLRSAIDDVRAEIEWAARNLMQARPPEPPQRVTSMSADPCDPEWPTKLNRLAAHDLPRDNSDSVPDLSIEHAMTAQNEAVGETPMYCCPEPRLAWQDDPEAPSVVCQACGYTVAEYGNVVDNRAEQQDAFHKPQQQGRLWPEDNDAH